MSDEEKKAIENVKSFVYSILNGISAYDCKILLNLVEKQQKKIEELKQNIHLKEVYVLKTNDYIKGTNDADELCNKKWEDKIKAKIEEYKKQQKEEPDAYLCIKVLQSLLEKE